MPLLVLTESVRTSVLLPCHLSVSVCIVTITRHVGLSVTGGLVLLSHQRECVSVLWSSTLPWLLAFALNPECWDDGGRLRRPCTCIFNALSRQL